MKTSLLVIAVSAIIASSIVFVAVWYSIPEECDEECEIERRRMGAGQTVPELPSAPMDKPKSQQSDSKPVYLKSFPITHRENSQRNYAHDVTVDSDGFIHVAQGNNSVEKYDSDGNLKKIFGHPGIPYDEKLYSTLGYMVNPSGVAVDDDAGILYVADAGNNRVQLFALNGTVIGSWGNYGIEHGNFDLPHGIVLDKKQNRVYVTDAGNSRIQVFDKNGNFENVFGKGGPQKGSFNGLHGLGIDANGNVYVADKENSRIQVFDKNLELIAVKTGFVDPFDVTVDSDGNVYVLTNAGRYLGLVQKFDSNWNKQYTLTTRDFSDKYVPFEEYDVGFESIRSVAVDSKNGLIYVLDYYQGIHVFEE